MELRGTAAGVAVYDDFAHHPTAIAETLAGVRSAYPDRRVWAIFEPRSATSCRQVFQADFARAFADADRILLPAVFRSTLPEDRAAVGRAAGRRPEGARQGRALHPSGRRHRRRPSRARHEAGDLVVVMSNGGFDDIHQKLLTALDAASAAMIAGWTSRIIPAGDAAWLIELPERLDAAVNARAIDIARGRRSAPRCPT